MPMPSREQEFLIWCTQVLGIQTSLQVENFEYYDYMRMSQVEDDDICDNNVVFPIISARGLAASRDIRVGDVVISIPFHALISVPTTIDHDPVLSGILGPPARAKYGWEDDASYFESTLLAIAILYHSRLGNVSPLHNYIQVLETNTPLDSMPLLWDKARLKREMTRGVRKIVKGILQDTREMYDIVMEVLRENHPAVFLDNAYSYERFQWAFAMVNSRHWYLPIPDLNSENQPKMKRKTEESEYGFNEQVLPASQPTEEWVREQEEIENMEQPDMTRHNSHSFLAPMADLLNFGPPCTQGRYNTEKKTFEIVATCPFLAGQEVTFFYSDDCEDVIIANYGFTHPMVPKCPSADEWRERSELWQRRAEALELELEKSFQELGQMDVELEVLHSLLRKCDCDVEAPESRPVEPKEESANGGPTQLRREVVQVDGIRGGASTGHGNAENTARHGFRRKLKQPKSKADIGL